MYFVGRVDMLLSYSVPYEYEVGFPKGKYRYVVGKKSKYYIKMMMDLSLNNRVQVLDNSL